MADYEAELGRVEAQFIGLEGTLGGLEAMTPSRCGAAWG
jgi:hypothetical protein